MSKTKSFKLLLATGNAHKAGEMKAILADFPFELVALADMPELKDLPDPEETGSNYLENALIKAEYYGKAASLPCLADDSGLEVKALDGAPGLYSHRFLSQCRTQAEKNACMLDILKDKKADERYAQFRCVCVIKGLDKSLIGDKEYITSEAVCAGQIALSADGAGGFGYDPIFYLPQYECCMAALSPEEKNKISHRGQAVRAAAAELMKLLDK